MYEYFHIVFANVALKFKTGYKINQRLSSRIDEGFFLIVYLFSLALLPDLVGSKMYLFIK